VVVGMKRSRRRRVVDGGARFDQLGPRTVELEAVPSVTLRRRGSGEHCQ
jgi:hypothetical protein